MRGHSRDMSETAIPEGTAARDQREALADLLRARAGRPKTYPLSLLQQGIWLVEQLEPGQPAFNMSIALRLVGALDRGAFARSLAEVVRRHGTLRTTFRSSSGRPVQVVAPATQPALWWVDLSALAPRARGEEVERRLAVEARRPFDLERGPLLRSTVFCLAETEHALLLNVHHLVADAWSLGVLTRELVELYAAFSRGGSSPLSELPLQYADFAVWQRARFTSGGAAALVDYWRARLDGWVELRLPTDHPRPPARSFRGGTVRLAIPEGPTATLRALAQAEGATLSMVLAALCQILLGRWTGQEDVVLGLPIAGRNRIETEGLIGPFNNMVVLRTALAGDLSWRAHLARVREAALGAYAHQDLPFEQLVRELGWRGDPGRHPVVQVALNVRNVPAAARQLPGLSLHPLGHESGSARLDLELILWEEPAGLQGSLIYATDLFSAATAARLARHFERLAAAVAADPGQRLAELSALLPNDEIPADTGARAAPGAAAPARNGLPSTPVERALAALFAEVLEVKKVGLHDNFFVLGGDSLRAMQVRLAIERDFAVDVSLQEILEKPSVAALAALIGERQGAQPDLLAEIEQLSDEEALRLLTAAAEPEADRMEHWLIARLAEYGDRPALVSADRPVSYRELLAATAEQVAELRARGVKRGESVALVGDYSPATTALLLALVENGNVAVPLTPAGWEGREAHLDLARVSAVFEEDPEVGWRFSRRVVAGDPPPLLAQLRGEGEPGLVVFSSGSTGEVKASLHRFNRILDKFRQRRTGQRTLLFLLMDHLGGLNTLLHILSNGGTAVTVEERSPQAVCRAIARHQVELLPTTPTFLTMLLLSGAFREHDLSSLTLITYGSEPMPESTLRALHAAFPGVRKKQTYGLSEVGALRTRSRAPDSLWVQVGGEQFATRVVDGMLWIRAESAMLGYLNAPSPFDADGWLNTGDMVEIDGEYLRILGRASEIINVGGEKVYPAEVESVLLEMENVRDATVRGRPNPVTGKVVTATLSLFEPEDPRSLARRVREFCQGRLARFKIPVVVEISPGELPGARFKKMREIP
jgi:long-chain acyl-CoA synthetase